MSLINTNFKGVIEKGDYESGDYTFVIKDAAADQGRNGIYVKLALQFVDSKYAGLFTEEFVSFSEKALWKAKQFLKAVGYEVPDGPMSIETKDLIDLSFKCHAEREVDPTGKYPPKLKIATYWSKDYQPTNLAPETATPPVTTLPAAGSGAPTAPVSSPSPSPAAAAPAAPAANPAEAPARPKVKV